MASRTPEEWVRFFSSGAEPARPRPKTPEELVEYYSKKPVASAVRPVQQVAEPARAPDPVPLSSPPVEPVPPTAKSSARRRSGRKARQEPQPERAAPTPESDPESTIHGFVAGLHEVMKPFEDNWRTEIVVGGPGEGLIPESGAEKTRKAETSRRSISKAVELPPVLNQSEVDRACEILESLFPGQRILAYDVLVRLGLDGESPELLSAVVPMIAEWACRYSADAVAEPWDQDVGARRVDRQSDLKGGVSHVALAATGGYPPTSEQAAIVSAAQTLRPGEILKVFAFAGAGKTSTIRLIAESIPEPACYAAFNKVIQKDSQGKFPKHVNCQTLDSIAFNAMGLRPDDITNLNGGYVRDLLGGQVFPDLSRYKVQVNSQAYLVAATITAYCQSGLPAMDGTAPDWLRDLVDHVLDARLIRRDAPVPESAKEREKRELRMKARAILLDQLPEMAERAWARIAGFRENRLKISHAVYAKLFELDDDLVARTFRMYRWVGVDEAQDLNPVQISIVKKTLRPIIAVGDTFQQIYSWRGAENALENLPGDKIYYLSQSFRFGAAIAKWAMFVLNSKPSGGPAVPLRGSDKGSRLIMTKSDDPDARVVVCRTNAGVLREAVAGAKSGKKVHVLNDIRKFTGELESAVALYQGRIKDVVSDDLRRYASWAELKADAELLSDPALQKLIEAVESSDMMADLALLKARMVGSEGRADLIVGTTHAAKGKEWPIVRLANDFPTQDRLYKRMWSARKRGRPDQAAQVFEEWNVLYVAGTRAIVELQLPSELYMDYTEPSRRGMARTLADDWELG